MSRYPFDLPHGWFCVGWTDDVAVGEVKGIKYFGRELVLWRDEQGGIHLQDAYCPHLGAHLAFGGTVDDCQIVCPFHGWKFDANGDNSLIPYSERLNKKAKIHTYEAFEVDEFIVAWFHPLGDGPTWDRPQIEHAGDPKFSDFLRQHKHVKAASQELCENGVDGAHFKYIHGTDTVPILESYEYDGHHSIMKSAQKFVTPQGVMDARIDVENLGPGLAITWFTGIVDTYLVAWTTPVDANNCEVRMNYKVRGDRDDPGTSNVAKAFMKMVNQQFEEDRPVWENKAHLVRPALIDTDGPFMKFRKWYEQFYADINETWIDPLGITRASENTDRAAAIAAARVDLVIDATPSATARMR